MEMTFSLPLTLVYWPFSDAGLPIAEIIEMFSLPNSKALTDLLTDGK